MGYFYAVLGFLFSMALIKHRESIGNSLGEAPWMRKVGGIYNIVVIFAIMIFFWSLSYVTGTMDIFLAPVLWIFPTREAPPPMEVF